MNKRGLLLFSTLNFNCQAEDPRVLESIGFQNIEITTPENSSEKNIEDEKIQPRGIKCTINLSNHFIPPLMSQARDADKYFSTEGSLQNPFQRERFGIFSSFAHHQKQFEHYAKAIERRGNREQPIIEPMFIPYTTAKTIKNIFSLEQQLLKENITEKQREQVREDLERLQKHVQEVKDIQQILQWGGHYTKEIDGIYDWKTSAAIMQYQNDHRSRLINPVVFIDGAFHELKADGRINRPTREMLNQTFEEHAFAGVQRVLEERVFHAECEGRYPYVIEQQELQKLVKSSVEQLSLNTIKGVQEFFFKEQDSGTVYLDLPPRYQQDSIKLEIEVEKWEKKRTESKLILYAQEGKERIELFKTKIVVGGKVKNKKTGKKKEYDTPAKEFYIKNVFFMPFWNPKIEVQQQEEVKEEEMLPGPFNAFGMMLAPLYNHDKSQKKPFNTTQDGYDGYGIHLTAWPSSIENIGASHGCIRVHPNKSRLFYFMIQYTPHRLILEDYQGRETIRFVPLRGSSIPFEPEHYIKVQICEKKCKS